VEAPVRIRAPFAAWAVALGVWSVALWRGAASAQWRGDLPALRDRGLLSVTFGGSLSAGVTQVMQLVPLGSRAERAAAGSALAAAVAAVFLFRIVRRLLPSELPPWLASLCAAVAALGAALSPSWQTEATVGGGAAVAMAAVLAGADAAVELAAPQPSVLTPETTRRWLVLAVALAAALAESVLAAGALALCALTMLIAAGRAPGPRVVRPMLMVGLIVAVLLAAPFALRPFAPRTFGDLARLVSPAGLAAVPKSSGREAVLSWLEQLGWVTLGLAIVGLVLGASRERIRARATMLVVLPLCDLLLPAPQWLDGTPSPLRPLCVGAFSVAAALGVAELVLFLRALDVPMARFASVLTVVFHMTLAAVVCEEASFAADRADRLAAEAWTDEALARLPRNAAVVVASPELAWRLWAAQRVDGQRPDVLLIATPLMVRSAELSRLLSLGSDVTPLLRDLSVTGRASEYALSLLADARPLEVELDAAWDGRMLSHVALDGPWLRFQPETLGMSDRAADSQSALLAEARVAASLRAGARRDAASVAVVGRTLKEQTAALSLIGMAPATAPLLDELERLMPDDPFAVSARLRLAHAQRLRRRTVELRDLLRF
jgi:hypothetical protein